MAIPVGLASQANAGSNLCPSKQVCLFVSTRTIISLVSWDTDALTSASQM